MDIRDKKVLVVGLGKSGKSATLFLYQQGARVAATDSKPANSLCAAMQELKGLPIRLCLGEHPDWLFDDAELIVLSPGVPKSIPPIQRAIVMGKPVISEIELASWFLKDNIIAITGSNGKSTVTTLTAHLMKKAGLDCEACGNIGTPLIEMIPGTRAERNLAVELSSFQLETIENFRPHIATVLNVTPDHMDRYPDFDAYRGAKLAVFRNQTPDDFAVVNADEQHADLIAKTGGGRKIWFGHERDGRDGMFVENGKLVWQMDGERHEICSQDKISIPGPHNLSNAMASAAMALLCGADPKKVALGLRDFIPLEHRLEPVAEIDGVLYVNDSKATNIDSASVALQSYNRPLWVILGGRDKAGDFSVLEPLLKKRARMTLLIGEAAGKIDKTLSKDVERRNSETLEAALKAARAEAKDGDVVLLSPGCASFDQFDSFEHRGREFKRIVRELENAES